MTLQIQPTSAAASSTTAAGRPPTLSRAPLDKVVLLTGVTSGIGRATALALGDAGARLVLGSRSAPAGQALLDELHGRGVRAEFLATDVTREADLARLVERAVQSFGRLDVAVNNAGLEAVGPLDAVDEATYTRLFDTNVKAVLFAVQAQARAMRATGGGTIINLSSRVGHRGMAGAALYAASKHAVEGLSRSAALELAPVGIRVNVVAPGPIATPMLDRFTGGQPTLLAGAVPLARIGRPEEVARAIVWLASDEASFVNGAVLEVDGGMAAA